MVTVRRRVLEFFSLAHRHQRRLDEARRDRDLMVLRAGGWTCHACGDARPDEMVGVRTATVTSRGRVAYYVNRRYCVDRPECAEHVATQLDEIRRNAVNRKKEQP